MVFFIILFFFQSHIIRNQITVEGCQYGIPLYENELIQFICNGDMSYSNGTSINYDNKLVHTIYTGSPILYDHHIITASISNQVITYYQVKLRSPGIYYAQNIINKLKDNGNVCFFQMNVLGVEYFFSAYIDYDLFLHIVQFNFYSFVISSELISDVLIKGPTIDCKGFPRYNHIICVFSGYDGCNLNIYSPDFSEGYSGSLIKVHNLVELGFDCNSKSPGQKIYAISDIKFFVCYSKQGNNNIYCLRGQYETSDKLKILNSQPELILENCDTSFDSFNIDKIGYNYALVCKTLNDVKYKIFSEDFKLKSEPFIQSYTNGPGHVYTIRFPFILYVSPTLSILSFDYSHEYESGSKFYNTKYFNLESPICTNEPEISGFINTYISLDLSNNFGSTPTDLKVRIFNIPSIGTYEYSTDGGTTYNDINIEEYILITAKFRFKLSVGGTYTYSYYGYKTTSKLMSKVCTGSIKIHICNESCLYCTESEIPLSHRCTQCLVNSNYYPLEERESDSIKNCYNTTTILELDSGYYLDTFSSTNHPKVWKECYRTCKTCSTIGTATKHLCKTCKEGLTLDINSGNNCVTSCESYWYRDTNKVDHICIDGCNEDYPYLVIDTKECVNSCNNANNLGKTYYYYDGKCFPECPSNTLPDAINNICHELNNFEDFYKGITNYIISVNPPSNVYVYNNKIKFYLYNSTDDGMKDYKELTDLYNITILNLDDCFNKIRNSNIINENYIFYVALFEFNRDDVMTPQYNFIIFNQNGVKYQNNICDKILISKSFKNSTLMNYVFEYYQNYSLDIIYYSESNKFYNDICTPVSNESYDILLEDRYDLYHNNSNYYFCEENCNITNIDVENSKVNCICSNITSFFEYEKATYKKYKENKIIKDKNFQFMKCSKLLFKNNFFTKNYGNYIILVSIFFQIINVIVFFSCSINQISILLGKTPPKPLEKIQINYENDFDHLSEKSGKNSPNSQNEKINKNINKNEEEQIEPSNPPKLNKETDTYNIDDDENIKKNNYYVYKVGKSIENFYNDLMKNGSRKIYGNKKKSYKKKDNYFTEKNSNEIESEGNFKDGITSQKLIQNNNSFSRIYCLIIKRKHKFITLCNNDKYDICIYKFSLFILTISLDLMFCCLFNFNSNISKLYKKKKELSGKEILTAIYSLLCTYFITKIIDCIMEYKSELEENKNMISENDLIFIDHYLVKTKIKFVIYFILTFLITGFCWFTISLYCATYPHSIDNLLICFAINFIISFLLPFLFYSFVTCLRYSAIKNHKYKLYEFTSLLLRF